MGGLVARYAVQSLGVREVDKIITLDTGHLGFDLAAIVDNIFIDPLKKLISMPTLCCIDAAPNSKFVNDLNSGFPTFPALVSIAALDPVEIPSPVLGLPPIKIIVVDTHSSNMGQFYPLHYNHLSIAQITDSDHGAYKTIKKCLS